MNSASRTLSLFSGVIGLSMAASFVAFAQTPTVTRTVRGDTLLIHTTGDGVWGPLRDATEIRRVPRNSKETTLNSVLSLAATPDGGVLVFDNRGADGFAVRQFDSTGAFVRNIGKQGTGKDQYENFIIALDVYRNGTILLRDGSRAVLRFSSTGVFEKSMPLRVDRGGLNEVVAADDGSFFVRTPGAQIARELNQSMLTPPMIQYDSAGRRIGTQREGVHWLSTLSSEGFTPTERWTMFPDGRMLITRSDKAGFLLSDPSGKSPPLVAEVAAQPIAYLDEERKELQAVEDFRRKNFSIESRPPATIVPEFKHPARPIARVDLDRRIWISRTTVGEKIPPRMTAGTGGPRGMTATISVTYTNGTVYSAFQADGTYLGDIRFPTGTGPVSFVGNTAWAMGSNSSGQPVLVKYRIP